MRPSDFPRSTSPACPYWVPGSGSQHHPLRARSRDLPVPVRGEYAHARVLRPRGVQRCLANTAPPVWPSASSHGVGTPDLQQLRGSIAPACAVPCQRFADALTSAAHDSGPVRVATPYSVRLLPPLHLAGLPGALGTLLNVKSSPLAGKIQPLTTSPLTPGGLSKGRPCLRLPPCDSTSSRSRPRRPLPRHSRLRLRGATAKSHRLTCCERC